jgi:ATP-binding cassette subfamily B protein/subfamily B ATP-binding cassette protein MsbA
MQQPISSKQREAAFYQKKATAGANPNTGRVSKEQRRRYLRQYGAWLWPNRWAMATVLVLALIVTALDMAWPIAIKLAVDLVSEPGQQNVLRRMVRLAVAAIGVLLLKQTLDSTRSYRVALLNARVVFTLRRRLYERLLELPLAELSEMKSGGIVSRLSGDVESVSGLVQMAIISPGVAIIRVVLTVIILVYLSWRLALATLVVMPVLGAASYLWLRKVRPIYRSIREDYSHIDARVNETFGGIRVVRAFRRENREGKNYALGHHTVIRKSLHATRVELVLEAVWGLLIPATSLLLVFYGGMQVRAGLVKLGSIFAFQIYAVLLLQPVWQIVQSVSQTQKSLAAMERIFGVLEMPADKPNAPGAVEAQPPVREMRFEHVEFAYRAGSPVIKDFSLVVPGGATVAFVGPSGAGKTTMTDLVARFYDPTGGAIYLNGVDLRKIQLASYRNLLAVVQQETFLFDGTVRENIAYGRRGATDELVMAAAGRANADGFIRQMPQGYDTLIGERGFKLSGGQRQRLSIARAMLADPAILILDEATSNLDTESEQLIQGALDDLLANRTTFVIAHRLSTISHADVIVVMEEGRVVETGKHTELMEKRGLYFEMVERQRRSMGVLEETGYGGEVGGTPEGRAVPAQSSAFGRDV